MIVLASFFFFFLLMLAVGLMASMKAESSTEDYLLAGRSVGAFPMALSAVASKVSGFMFIGMLGYVYVKGFSSLWFLVAWIISDWLIWKFFYRPIREISENENITTITSFCVPDLQSVSGKYLLRFLALIIIVFMGVYAAAQLSAGAKALESVLSINYSFSVILAAILIAMYCFAGGIRASIWTDSVQAIIMLLAILILAFVAFNTVGGYENLVANLSLQKASLVEWIPQDLKFGFILFFLGRLANGFALLGQPHVVVRSMLIKDIKSLKLAEKIYFTYYILFCLALFVVALTARVILPDLIHSDPELALMELSKNQLPNYLIGLILAGVFSSTISTADSQILSCTASITQDLFEKWKNNYWLNKIVTLLILVFVTILALLSNESVFALTMFGWVSLGVVFTPLIFIRVFNIKIKNLDLLLICFISLFFALLWRFSSFHPSLNEVFVGFLCFGILFLAKKIFRTGS